MVFRLSADEVACVKKLAELFESGESWVTASQSSDETDSLGLPLE